MVVLVGAYTTNEEGGGHNFLSKNYLFLLLFLFDREAFKTPPEGLLKVGCQTGFVYKMLSNYGRLLENFQFWIGWISFQRIQSKNNFSPTTQQKAAVVPQLPGGGFFPLFDITIQFTDMYYVYHGWTKAQSVSIPIIGENLNCVTF